MKTFKFVCHIIQCLGIHWPPCSPPPLANDSPENIQNVTSFDRSFRCELNAIFNMKKRTCSHMFWEKKINSFFTELTGSTSSEQNWVNKFERMLKDIMISTWRVFVVLYTCKRVGGPFPLMGCWSKRDACEFCIIARFFHHLKKYILFHGFILSFEKG